MSFPIRTVRTLLVVAALAGAGCSEDTTDPGWTCSATVDATGVWDVSRTSHSGPGVSCLEVDTVWTLAQSACDVAIASQEWDPANGKTGTVTGNTLQARWTYDEGCYRYVEEYDVTIDGHAMTGTYYLMRVQAVFPAYCPGTGLCSSTVSGTRRVP